MTTPKHVRQECSDDLEEAILSIVDEKGRTPPEKVAYEVEKDEQNVKGCMRQLVHRGALQRAGHRVRNQCFVKRSN
jgi:DNA-binding Lrp family transcriptional regulator